MEISTNLSEVLNLAFFTLQEVVSSEPQQVFMTSSGEQIVYNNDQELMTSLADMGQVGGPNLFSSKLHDWY